jgi:AcrR family transcriptional regulator
MIRGAAVIKEGRKPDKGQIARERVKKAARKLFIRYGIDKVTIRDIAKAAGQKNGGAVNYYFGSKEDLVLEILNDVARDNETREAAALDRLEASGAEIRIRDILGILMGLGDEKSVDDMRIFTILQTYRRDSMHTEIPDRWDTAYKRCVAHLRRLIPHHSEQALAKRLYFLIPYLWTFLATRGARGNHGRFWESFWEDPQSLETLLDTAEGILVYVPRD